MNGFISFLAQVLLVMTLTVGQHMHNIVDRLWIYHWYRTKVLSVVQMILDIFKHCPDDFRDHKEICPDDFTVSSVNQMLAFEALLGDFGNRGMRAFISGEQGNKGLKMRGTGEQRQFWRT